MAFHLRANFPDFFIDLLPGLDSVYMQAKDLDETKAAYKALYNIKSSDAAFENVSGVSGFDVFQNVGEAEEVPLMNIAQLFDKKFTHIKWAGAYGISEEMTDDDNFEIVASMARAHARAFRYTKEVDLAGPLNNGGTAATESSADGSAIFATHTRYDGGTTSNTVSTDFGVAAAQTMFNYFATLVDDRGHDINISPKYIFANPAMKWVIKETMESAYKPFAATNEINALNDETLQDNYWARITDTDAWYVSVDPADLNGNGLRLYNRQDFTTSNDFDVRNLTMFVVGRGRWSRGCIDWRQLYRSVGA